MNLLSVLFQDRSKSSAFLRKLYEFGAYANSLEHLDCNHGILAVFYDEIFYFRKQISLPSMRAGVRICACAISIANLDLKLFMFGSHI